MELLTNLRKSKISRAPGPKGHFLWGNIEERRKDPLGLFRRAEEEFGPICEFRMGPRRVLLVSESDTIKQILLDSGHLYMKGFGYDRLEAFLGKGLLTNEGESWRRQRKLAQPAFHRPNLQAVAQHMVQATTEWVEDLKKQTQNNSVIDIHHALMLLTRRIVSLTLLGRDIGSKDNEQVGTALDHLIEEANNRILDIFPIPKMIPTPRNLKARASEKIIDEVLSEIIEEHRAHSGTHNSLLSMLMAARDDETGKGMSNQQLRDEVITFFVAGHETTANALTWTLMLLSQNEFVKQKLFSEVQSVVGEKTVGFNELSSLKYMTQVLEEGMRLYPPAWLVSREAIKKHQVLGVDVRPGDIVVMSQWAVHHSTRYWEQPDVFDPERFTEDKKESRPKFSYFPFGGGPRICIGNHFAMMEAQIVLSELFKVFDVLPVEGFKVELEPLVTLRPKNGLLLNLKNRDGYKAHPLE